MHGIYVGDPHERAGRLPNALEQVHLVIGITMRDIIVYKRCLFLDHRAKAMVVFPRLGHEKVARVLHATNCLRVVVYRIFGHSIDAPLKLWTLWVPLNAINGVFFPFDRRDKRFAFPVLVCTQHVEKTGQPLI